MFSEKHQNVLQEYEKFWERTNTTRPILNFSYTKNTSLAPYPAPTSPQQKYLDENYILGAYRYNNERNGYVAEGYQRLFTNLGPGCLAAFIGGHYELAPNTVWFDRTTFIKDWENAPEVFLNENSELYQHLLRLQTVYAKEQDVYFTITDIGGILDVVASLRQTEALLYDLYDYPDEVKAFCQKVKIAWNKLFKQQVLTLKKCNLPYDSWIGVPSQKPYYPLQCDFCYMLSPDHFDEFVLPDLIDQANSMDRSIYHLDGVGELTHVDKILDIEKLNGIQWSNGAGQAPMWDAKWLPLYRKIQDKNKNLVLLGGISEHDLAGAERLIKSIDPVGVYISAHFSSKEKAEEMVEKITLWSR